MGQSINILENALRAWEDFCLMDEARVRAGIASGLRTSQDLVGPIRHWRELRSHILGMTEHGFDVERFTLSDNAYRPFGTFTADQRPYELLPLQIASWCHSSRRVFHLSRELVERFRAADYSRYRWCDLLWPFDAFAVSFEEPLLFDDWGDPVAPDDTLVTQAKLGLLLVSSIFGVCGSHPHASRNGFEVRTFFTEINGVGLPATVLNPLERERFEKDIRGKRWMKLNKRVGAQVKQLFGHLELHELVHSLPPGSPGPLASEKEEFLGDTSDFGKIIAGLCLYLEALPAGMAEGYGWREAPPQKLPRDARKLITEGEKVCWVEDFNLLSPETISLFPETLRQGPAYTVTPHWRRAHYRRAKGQGSNPDAPRNIYVAPTQIHKDQVPKGAVVGGSTSVVR